MLLHLTIRDFVIVDQIELNFKPGFTVLTGETGAGKSILIDALDLALGGRADAGLIRHGCERAEISAEFDIQAIPSVQAWLQENVLANESSTCLLRRVIEVNGRSRNFINGCSVSLQQLREASKWLIDIHGQHAAQSLLRSLQQCELLDAWAGKTDLAREVGVSYRHWQDLHHQRLSWEQNSAQVNQEREHLTWQTQELKSLNFSPEDWQTLQADHNRLAHTASLLEAAQFSLEALSESEAAALSQINATINQLHALIDVDSTIEPIYLQLESAQVQLQETVYELKHYQQSLDLDPQNLQSIEARIAAIHETARKYKVTPEALPTLLKVAKQRLETLDSTSDGKAIFEAEKSAKIEYERLAGQLSEARRNASIHLSKLVTKTMQTLAMAGGRFNVALIPITSGNQYGLEQVEFQVAAHPSLPLRPLNKVASGGELSRISLAIQVITSQAGTTPTLIFDEVDSGIGGRVAEIVGKLLKQLGKTRQVMCITHLAQVAAMGDQHWQVSKDAQAHEGEIVTSRIKNLDDSARIDEIARMLGGEKLTTTTHKHAAEMLQSSKLNKH